MILIRKLLQLVTLQWEWLLKRLKSYERVAEMLGCFTHVTESSLVYKRPSFLGAI